MVNVTLPFWLRSKQLTRIADAAQAFWHKIESVIAWQSAQIDPDHCDDDILDLLAWERDIKRLPLESIQSYRNRIKHAYANARDAGSVAGFKRIFTRLGVRYIDIYERTQGQPWDTITLHFDEGELDSKHEFIAALIHQYGRTCRRYQYALTNLLPSVASIGHIDHDHTTVVAGSV